MAKVIETTQLRLINEVLLRDFHQRRMTVINQSVIQDRALMKFVNDSENYVLSRIPERFYQGVPDVQIAFRLFNMFVQHWLPHYLDPNVPYIAGTIARNIEAVGQTFSSAVKVFTLAKTKASINNAVDVIASLSIDPMMISRAIPSLNQDFIHLMLSDASYRNTVLSRLQAVTIASPEQMDNDAVMNLAAMIANGRGEAIPAEYYPAHLALRSIILALLRTMVEASFTRPELFYDVLPAYSLFIIYVNITENEQVYDTAFPPISVSGANNIFHAKITASIKTMAVLFTKVGFTGKSFNGVLATRLLKEFFNLFPDLTDITLWAETDRTPDDKPIIDFTEKSYAQQNTLKYDAAVKTFDTVLPSMFSGYVENVIAEFKKATDVDVLLSSIADTIVDGSSPNMTAFPNLTEAFEKLGISLEDPEGVDSIPAHKVVEIPVTAFQTFVLSWMFPTTEAIYQLSLQVQQSYDRMLQNLGTPTGSLIPGINVELEAMGHKMISDIPDITSLNVIPYAKLTETYAFPFFISPLAIHSNGASGNNLKFERRQTWALQHLKFKYLRTPRLFANYAKNGEIFELNKAPGNLKLSTAKVNGSPFVKWSWPENSLPVPSYMQDIGFAFTPIPFNYTSDTVFDSISAKADSVEKLMIRTGRVPSINILTYGQIINAYMLNGTVQPSDLALAVAGLGFLYRYNGEKWEPVMPGCPTIYGMPTIIMLEANRLNVGELLRYDRGRLELSDISQPDSERVIFDRRSRGVVPGSSVLVIHKRVPTPHRLRFFMANLRNGFSVNIPFRADFYSSLMKSSLRSVRTNFSNGALIVDDNRTEANVRQKLKFVDHFDLHAIFAESLSIMLISPETGSHNTGLLTASGFFGKHISGISFEKFLSSAFEDVIGFSNVIAPYPHLTMRDRFDELHESQLNHVLRPLTSKIYFDTQFLRSKETVRIMALAPNQIEMMDATDEWNFYDNQLIALSDVNIGITPVKHSGKQNINVTVPGETTQVGGVPTSQNKNEGTEMTLGDLVKTGQNIPAAEVQATVPTLINVDTEHKGGGMMLDALEVQGEGADKINVLTNKNKPVVKNKMVDKELDTTRVEDDGNGNLSEKNTMGEGIDLNKSADDNKAKVGEGSPIDSEEEREKKRKNKPKGKKFTEDNSEDETDL